ncbi:TPA: peptide chain release factor 1 [Candidatus Uhrbacteria bacterium]|nr:peptide chain release factor 1 [Candidatus Uhrbacteria bacterium]
MDFIKDLKTYQERKRELEAALGNPAVFGDQKKLKETNEEFQRISQIVERIDAYQQAENELAQAREMMQDPEMKEAAEEEVTRAEALLAELEAKISLALLPPDPMDKKDVIMEIRAGAGGDEAALFATHLFRMYARFAERHGWNVSISSQSQNDLGGLKEITFSIKGKNVYQSLKFESGVHRVQRIPETEKQGRIHTSTATVAVLPEIEAVEFELDPKDLKVETSTSQGAGGQSVNTTYSAIRMVHLPTGIEVRCQDERSQQQNRAKAMEIMRSRVFAYKEEKRRAERDEKRRDQIGTGERSEKIRTYNYPQSRVTDHRIHESWHNLMGIMDGDLAAVTEALRKAQRAQDLESAAKNL